MRIDRIDAELVNLQDNIRQASNILEDMIVELLDGGREIDSRVDVLETYSNEVKEQIEYLEGEVSSLQTTILYAYIAITIIAILGAFLLIKRMH